MLGEELLEIDRLRIHLDLSREEADRLGQAADRLDAEPFDDGCLRGIGPRYKEPIGTFEDSLKGHREDALDRACLAGERQLADGRVIAWPVEGHLAAAQEQPQRD
jgi:hypothetical protein